MGLSVSLLDFQRDCPQCRGKAPIWDPVCLQCGHHILPMWWLRIVGPILVVLGSAVAGTLGYITYWMAKTMLHSSDPGATVHFTGTKLQAVASFAIVLAVCTLGIMFVGIGVGQILRATRSHVLIRLAKYAYVVVMLVYVVLLWSS